MVERHVFFMVSDIFTIHHHDFLISKIELIKWAFESFNNKKGIKINENIFKVIRFNLQSFITFQMLLSTISNTFQCETYFIQLSIPWKLVELNISKLLSFQKATQQKKKLMFFTVSFSVYLFQL